MSNPFDSSIETFGLIDIIAVLFGYIYPLILLYVVEFGNVTFRLLAKRCDRQPKASPIIAYLLALSVISGLIAVIASFAVPKQKPSRNFLKILSIISAVVIVRVMYSCDMGCRTIYIYKKHKKGLLEGHRELAQDPEAQYYQHNQDYSHTQNQQYSNPQNFHPDQEYSLSQGKHYQRKNFSQLLFGFWGAMLCEVTQKIVLN
jgi:hypothetical protein